MSEFFNTIRAIFGRAAGSDDPGHLTSWKSARGNAPLDPKGQRRADPSELTSLFNILRASFILRTEGPLPRYEDLLHTAQDAWFKPDEPPRAVLFISHRWETPDHPDPRGVQATALRAFLRNVRELAATASGSEPERSARVPSLLVHGVFQAAYFLDNGMTFGGDGQVRWDEPAKDLSESASVPSQEDVLERIGLWYDFACMPQGGPRAAKAETYHSSGRLIDALARIHELIGESTMIVLRHPEDAYESRAWCVAELSIDPDIELSSCRKIVMRLDMMGNKIPMSLLTEDAASEYSAGSRRILAKTIGEWATRPRAAMSRVGELYDMFLSELEAGRTTPLFTTPGSGLVFPAQREFMINMISALSYLTMLDVTNGKSDTEYKLDFDMAEVVAGAMQKAGLECTNPEDLIFTGFTILYARHRGAPEMAAFYANCLLRWLEGRSTTLARYREAREQYAISVWAVFDDESADSIGWQPPPWARGL